MDKGYVLIVDDEVNARSALAGLLRDQGFRVETAADGLAALGKLEERMPEIVLTDLKMPGMSGLDLLRKLRPLDKDGPTVLVMTAFGAVETAVSALREGAADYLTKPIDVTELVPVLEREIERQRLRRDAERAKLRLEAANRDLEAFAGRLAHDLRTPLTPLTLLAATIKNLSVDPKVVRMADRIASNAHRVGDMIEELLAFSRSGHQDQGAATVAAIVVRESLDDFAAQIADEHVVVETDLDADAVVACGSGLFREIVDNLVGNALKHLHGHERRWIRVRLDRDGGFVDLHVEDSGSGIPPIRWIGSSTCFIACPAT